MQSKEPCRLLPWDTEFFGFRIARVVQNRLTSHLISEVVSWSNLNAIECLYFLADSDDAQTIHLAEKNGFNFTDIRITMEKKLADRYQLSITNGAIIRTWITEDIPELQNIARNSFRMTRFYYDGRFPRSTCDALYETWIRKSCEGYADFVLVAIVRHKPVGFVTCKLTERSLTADIGLIGVSTEYSGKGIGTSLLKSALNMLIDRGTKTVNVVTQGRNIISQRLYQRCGFLTKNVQLWYHKWFRLCK